MKNILSIFLLIFVLSSCSYNVIAPYYKGGTYIDFKRYADNGVFISETPGVPFDYDPIGSLVIEVTNGEDRSKTKLKDTEKAEYINNKGNKVTIWPDANYPITSFTIYDAMDVMADSIKAMGGNGILNFKHELLNGEHYLGNKGKRIIVLDGYRITGMVFKRK